MKFKKKLLLLIKRKNPKFICLRDKNLSKKRLKSLAIVLKDVCSRFKVTSLINTEIEIAYRVKLDGVHLPSSMIKNTYIAKRKKLFTIASCHNQKEIKKATKADFFTISPLFYSPNKQRPLGINYFCRLGIKEKRKAIALGGIVDVNALRILKRKGIRKFASIRYFIL